MDVVGPFAIDSTLVTVLVFVGLLTLATVGMIGLVRRGGPISKVIGLTMLGAIAAGLVWAAIMVAIILPMQGTA